MTRRFHCGWICAAAFALSACGSSDAPQASADRHADVAGALAAARAAARPGERILAFGSFFVAAAVMAERDR